MFLKDAYDYRVFLPSGGQISESLIGLPSGKLIYAVDIGNNGLQLLTTSNVVFKGFDRYGNSVGNVTIPAGTYTPSITNSFYSPSGKVFRVEYDDNNGNTYTSELTPDKFDFTKLEVLKSAGQRKQDAITKADQLNTEYNQNINNPFGIPKIDIGRILNIALIGAGAYLAFKLFIEYDASKRRTR